MRKVKSDEINVRDFMSKANQDPVTLLLNSKDSTIGKHIISTWSDRLTVEDALSCAYALISTDSLYHRAELYRNLPSEITNNADFMMKVMTPKFAIELMDSKTITPEHFNRALSTYSEKQDYAALSKEDFDTFHKQGCLDEIKMTELIKRLAKGTEKERDRGIDLIASYGVSDANIVRALFKSELEKALSETRRLF